MKRSRPVDSSRYQSFCLTPSEQKVINFTFYVLISQNFNTIVGGEYGGNFSPELKNGRYARPTCDRNFAAAIAEK